MRKIAAELLVERLVDWNIDTVFGLPGDGINGLMEALRRHQDRIRFVLVHHEEAAAFMATGYAKSTGRIGVCLATSGPGGVHLLNGLYDAKLDHVPVLAITGMQETEVLGTYYQQEVHLEKLYENVAEYDHMITVPVQITTLVDIAIRTAYSRKTVSHITFPNDLQVADATANPWASVAPVRTPRTSPVNMPTAEIPPQNQLEEAAEVLNKGKKVAILAGAGSLHARDELLETADLLASPIVKPLPGKASVPDDNPFTTGGIGLLGTRPSEEVMEEIDTLLMVGTNFPYTSYLPKPGQAQVVQIEYSGERAGTRVPTKVPLVGDSAATLRALQPMLVRKTDRSFLTKAQSGMKAWRDKISSLEDSSRYPIQPQYLAGLINKMADDNAIFCIDTGTITAWAARHIDIKGDRKFYVSGNLATMAPGLPYVIAAQSAYPDRQCIAYVGDGGFAMLMAELMTASRYKLPIKVFINNNHEYGQILWEQMVLGYPEYGVRYDKPTDYAGWGAASIGFGVMVDKPDKLEEAVRDALNHPGPAIVDVHVNPDEPPMPPKVTYEQARNFGLAFERGESYRSSIAFTLFRDKIDEFRYKH
jgi:pyruvate dehydrogenase (quinone)/pyruvate oxidase